jgi:hypothetical protein
MRKCTTLLLVVLCAALAFGGSFTCNASSGDDDHSTTQGSR